MRPKRITPEQYLELGKLGFPILCHWRNHTDTDASLIEIMLDATDQEFEREYFEGHVASKKDYIYYTLVDDEEST